MNPQDKKSFDQRDIALRTVGRNIVNFQRLETYIKVLARFSPIACPLNNLSAAINNRASQTARYTFGQAIGEWLKMAGGSEPPTLVTEEQLRSWITMSFGPLLNSEELIEHSQALRELLKERNNLVHHDLAPLDFGSEEQCLRLIARLDSQNERIGQQMSLLEDVLTRIQVLHEVMSQPEIQAEIFKELRDPEPCLTTRWS